MASLVELNSEPAVEELSKQILSEAKLWEAIQEARQELRHRHDLQVGKQPLRWRIFFTLSRPILLSSVSISGRGLQRKIPNEAGEHMSPNRLSSANRQIQESALIGAPD